MKYPRLIAALVLVAVFVLGGVTGGLLARATTTHALRRAVREGSGRGEGRILLFMLDRDLSLTKPQRDQIEGILAEHQRELIELRKRIAPEARAIRQRQKERIREILTTEQRPAFDEIAAEFEARH